MSFAARPTGYSAPAGPNASLPANLNVSDNVPSGTSTASFTLSSGGTYSSVGNAGAPSGTWQTGTGTGSSYDARMTVSGGGFTSGTTGSWVSLSSNRTWSLSTTSNAFASATLEIRDAATTTVLTSSSFYMDVSVGAPP